MEEHHYRIGGHLVGIKLPKTVMVECCLSNFTAFETIPHSNEEILLSMELTTSPVPNDDQPKTLLSDVAVVWEEPIRFEKTDENYIIHIQGDDPKHTWVMISSKDFMRNKVHAPKAEWHSPVRLSWLMMIAFGQAALQRKTLLMHASVVKKGNKGYLFLGKSGTGKSTHSQLWLKYLPDTVLLNDDCPAVRIYPNGEIFVYGTPWSGKTPCHKQERTQVGAFVRLEQAPINRMEWKYGKNALITLLPSCPAIRWNKSLFDHMVTIVSEISTRIPTGQLQCRPDKHAVCISFKECTSKKVLNISGVKHHPSS